MSIMSGVTCQVSGVRCHMSVVTCQLSHVRWHMSGERCQVSHAAFFGGGDTSVEFVGGPSVINGAYSLVYYTFISLSIFTAIGTNLFL